MRWTLKNLIKIPNVVWITLSIIVSLTIVFVIFILQYEVETTKSVQIETDKEGSSLLLDSDTFYKMNLKSSIPLKFNGNEYVFKVQSWDFDEKNHIFKLKIHNSHFTLPSHAKVLATLKMQPKTIMSIIFGSV